MPLSPPGVTEHDPLHQGASRKIYCYVDETGQHNPSGPFIPGVVIVRGDRDALKLILEDIERQTRKNRLKWIDAPAGVRLDYMSAVLKEPPFQGALFYGIHHSRTDHLHCTAITVADAIVGYRPSRYKATILVDGLPKASINSFGAMLRRLGVSTDKVRGIRKEDTDALMRLADALCGFVREGLKGDRTGSALDIARKKNHVRQV
jgi:hypothetical protein